MSEGKDGRKRTLEEGETGTRKKRYIREKRNIIQSESACGIDILPPWVLKVVIEHLTTFADYNSARLVNKYWYGLVKQSRFCCLSRSKNCWRLNEIVHKIERFNWDEVQNQVTPYMRSILVDWIIDVCEEFGFALQTLFLAINYLDRYLSKTAVKKKQLQLLGITCLFIASKFEEVNQPPIEDFVYLCAETYSRPQIILTELTVLEVLKYELNIVTTYHFLDKYFKVLPTATLNPDFISSLAKYFAELSLMDFNLTKFFPSVVAVACLFLSLFVVHGGGWTGQLERKTRYSINDPEVRSCTNTLYYRAKNADGPLTSVVQKYTHVDNDCVARYPLPPSPPFNE